MMHAMPSRRSAWLDMIKNVVSAWPVQQATESSTNTTHLIFYKRNPLLGVIQSKVTARLGQPAADSDQTMRPATPSRRDDIFSATRKETTMTRTTV